MRIALQRLDSVGRKGGQQKDSGAGSAASGLSYTPGANRKHFYMTLQIDLDNQNNYKSRESFSGSCNLFYYFIVGLYYCFIHIRHKGSCFYF